MQIFTQLYHWDEHQWMHNSQIFHIVSFFFQKQQQQKFCLRAEVYIWSSGNSQTTFHTWVQNRWPRTEENRAQQSHAGPYWLPSCPAVQHTFNTVAAAALSCLMCAYIYVHVCVYVSPAHWPQLSLPLCWSPGQGWPLSWSHFKETRDGL